MDLQTILLAFFGMLGTIGAGLAMVTLGTVNGLKTDNERLRARDADREKQLVALETKVTQLETANDVLAAGVRNDTEINKLTAATTALTTTLQSHHDEARLHWLSEEALLRGITDELTARGA